MTWAYVAPLEAKVDAGMGAPEQGEVDEFTPAPWPVPIAARSPMASYRLCRIRGLGDDECRRLVARIHGLNGPFTPTETQRIRFLRWLADRGEWSD